MQGGLSAAPGQGEGRAPGPNVLDNGRDLLYQLEPVYDSLLTNVRPGSRASSSGRQLV